MREIMKNHDRSKQNSTLSFGARLFVFIMLASFLSSCGVIAPVPTDNAIDELNPIVANPTTQESTPNPPTEVATEMPKGLIKIDMDNVIFPPMGSTEENFDKGEYDISVEVIKQWVSIWGKMGVFDYIDDIYDSGLVLVPLLAGREKVTCVALKSDKYANTLFCPPMDNINGGLKIISDSGPGKDTDKPIVVNLMGTESLTIRGKGNELTYQIADKYTNKGIRYYDINANGFVDGSFIAPLEVKENEPIEGSVVCVADEFCMGGQMKVDEEMAPKFYKRFINALVNNEENREYFNNLLSGNISLASLQNYLAKSDGIIPPGLKLARDSGGGYFRMNYVVDREIRLHALKMITFGPIEWKNNIGNIQEYISSVDKVGLANPFTELGVSLVFLGWFIDSSGYMVLVSGSKDFESNHNDGRVEDPFPVIGGKDGKYIPERDNMIATATFLSWPLLFENSQKSRPFIVVPLADIPGQPMILKQDVVNFFGDRTLFIK
jgi:hypothetical protein